MERYSIGYSKKGWIDGELGVLWIQEFDKATRAAAKGRARLLLVDGHNSHYTRGFIYQGLDVVVFAVLKQRWYEERDRWEREGGGKVDKNNFATVYARAHKRAISQTS
jgi:hypothetical protein